MAKARIFVVEDEVIVAEVLKMNLERSGYEIAGHEIYGEAVVESVARSKPDLILMDIRLKGKINGIAAAIQVRARFDIPIIYLTAYGDAETAPGHTCKTCGGPLAAPGRDGEGLVKGLSTCPRCGAVHRFDFYALRRWPGDAGTAYEAHLQTPGKEVTA